MEISTDCNIHATSPYRSNINTHHPCTIFTMPTQELLSQTDSMTLIMCTCYPFRYLYRGNRFPCSKSPITPTLKLQQSYDPNGIILHAEEIQVLLSENLPSWLWNCSNRAMTWKKFIYSHKRKGQFPLRGWRGTSALLPEILMHVCQKDTFCPKFLYILPQRNNFSSQMGKLCKAPSSPIPTFHLLCQVYSKHTLSWTPNEVVLILGRWLSNISTAIHFITQLKHNVPLKSRAIQLNYRAFNREIWLALIVKPSLAFERPCIDEIRNFQYQFSIPTLHSSFEGFSTFSV